MAVDGVRGLHEVVRGSQSPTLPMPHLTTPFSPTYLIVNAIPCSPRPKRQRTRCRRDR